MILVFGSTKRKDKIKRERENRSTRMRKEGGEARVLVL